MKQFIQSFLFISIAALLLVACEKEISAPVFKSVEIGLNNSKTAYIGDDLHLEADIIADGKIASIRLVIHHEEEGAEHAPKMKIRGVAAHAEEWEVDTIYTGVYANVKNTTFHEHIEVPEYAEPGSYHLHLYVTDLDGNQSMIEEEITILTQASAIKKENP
ncbi:MAG: DUF4625 domain-containing protein [Paludibacter sp.]|nr:DUF4625 domain-containing protein [Paludibacter sp.]